MCGLIGQASTEATKQAAARRDTFKECLLSSVLRGADSTGVGFVKKGHEKTPADIFKKALASYDFLQLNRFDRYLSDFSDYAIVMGHTRAATNGRPTDSNAHPFQEGHITLTHNGHISNAYQLLPFDEYKSGADVDSHRMCIAMARKGELEALEMAEGAFALVWHNAKKGTLNFARNSGRPLKFAFIKDQNTLFWASERLMLRWRLEENNLEVDGTYKNLAPGAWIEFDLADLRKFKIHHFSQRPRGTGATSGRTNSTAPTTPVSDTTTFPPKTSSNGMSTSNDATATPTGRVSVSNILSYHRSVITKLLANTVVAPAELERRAKEFGKSSGRSTKRRAQNAQEEQLRRFGLAYEQDMLVRVTSFEPYKNQENRLGCVEVMAAGNTYAGRIMHISRADFMEMTEMQHVLVKAIGVSYDSINKPRLLLERHPLYREFSASHKEWMKKTTKEAPKSNILSLPSREPPANDSDSGEGHTDRFTHAGPNGKAVSLDKFLELTKEGCGSCSADIAPNSHKELLWLHGSPICLDCQTNPARSEALGLNTH